jgi:hypothetical protein
LDLESAIVDAMAGEAPDLSWRERSAPGLLRSVTALTGYVFIRERQQSPFAQLFDTDRTNGAHMFTLGPDEAASGVTVLQGRSVRTRRNVLAALASLLSKPAALTSELAEALQWRTVPDHRGPFRVLADHIGEAGRRRLRTDLAKLPVAIAEPARIALDRATAELG